MASDALLTLLPQVGGSNLPVSPSNKATISTIGAPGALGVGANPATGINAANYLDLKTLQGTRKNNPLVAYIVFDTATGTGGANTTALFTIDHADDNGSGAPGTWQVLHAADQGPITLSGTAITGQAWITIGRSKRYIRLNAYLGSTTASSVSINKADIRMAEP